MHISCISFEWEQQMAVESFSSTVFEGVGFKSLDASGYSPVSNMGTDQLI